MRTKIIAILLLTCSCASVRKSITKVEQHRDSVTVSISSDSTVSETTIRGSMPAYTRPDIAGLTWYLPAEDTSTRSESVSAGSLVLSVTSSPRRDSAGKVSGRDLHVHAHKHAEEVMVPVDFHQVTIHKGSTRQGTKVNTMESQSTSEKNRTGVPGLTGLVILAGVLLAVVLLFKYFVRR